MSKQVRVNPQPALHSGEISCVTTQRHRGGNKTMMWWQCEHGHRWRESLRACRTRKSCPKCLPANTSCPEQMLFHAMQASYDSAQNRADLFFRGNPIEVDIFLPELPLAIEYDGKHHRSRSQKDEQKNYLLYKLSIPLIRIRDATLPDIKDYGCCTLFHDTNRSSSLHECIEDIYRYIRLRFGMEPREQVLNAPLQEQAIDAATPIHEPQHHP